MTQNEPNCLVDEFKEILAENLAFLEQMRLEEREGFAAALAEARAQDMAEIHAAEQRLIVAAREFEALERAKIAESDEAKKLEGRLRGEVGGLREQLRLLADWQINDVRGVEHLRQLVATDRHLPFG